MSITQVSCNKVFGGLQKVFSHESLELKCAMKFAVFLPPNAANQKLPVLFYLSGLTCTEQNVIQKGAFHKSAAQHGLIVVAPDTSPRNCKIEGEDDAYDFGSGAGFYIDATRDPWKTNYRMYSYVTKELYKLVSDNFSNNGKFGITGHSMGGHGALTLALKHPELFDSVSAFAPICHPTQCDWGKKAFSGYLGGTEADWLQHDAVELIRAGKRFANPAAAAAGGGARVLVDQGGDDQFLHQGQLRPEDLKSVCAEQGVPLELRIQEGYDHSYFFIASFMEDHIRHHAALLK